MQGWSLLKAHHLLPVSGGTMEQAACFLRAVSVLDSAQAIHQQREDDKRGR